MPPRRLPRRVTPRKFGDMSDDSTQQQDVRIEPSWKARLGAQFAAPHMAGLGNFLRAEKAAGMRPYVPGAMVCWELMVGNSNTRWHWGTAPGTAEPAIPWDAWPPKCSFPGRGGLCP